MHFSKFIHYRRTIRKRKKIKLHKNLNNKGNYIKNNIRNNIRNAKI